MHGLTQGLAYGIVAILVVAWVIRRQMTERAVTPRRMLTIPVVLLLAGLANGATVLDELDSPTAITLLVAGLLLGAVTGAARAASQRLTWRNGTVYSRGTRWTVVLWVATVLVRIGMAVAGAALDAPEGTGEILVFLAVTLGVQNLLLVRRAGVPLLGTTAAGPAAPAEMSPGRLPSATSTLE